MDLRQDTNAHIYRPSQRLRRFFLVAGSFYVLVGTCLFLLTVEHALLPVRPSMTAWLNAYLGPLAGLGLAIIGASQARSYWRRVLILSDTKIGTEFTFGFRELDRNEVIGKRIRWGKQGPQTVLIPKARRFPKIVIHSNFVVDQFYESWIASVPDLGDITA
ncbi:hypothetical protein AciX9_4670 (plasmid) [Granulicella tundricola MP5ACTX9]|uniref:Uncharacterized protein n=2 Tax=Granulicella TaxID=940557 RepID=E8X808_GRATM|nr:hypothetical protein AciX9_4662 [Granulicella tundricola MP5ACTX9]ADW71600.1 hypothetical protein AciX9_4670 [Granulicella tundricola MP5ACTX9]